MATIGLVDPTACGIVISVSIDPATSDTTDGNSPGRDVGLRGMPST